MNSKSKTHACESGVLGFLFLALTMFGPTALAQSADEQTPAEESVCDPLKADGITKGLYGLCVAFCEAQDHAAVSSPISEANLAALENEAPSGRILASYNRKKQVTDPDMPCILVEESCPCWTAEKLSEIDGMLVGVHVVPVSCLKTTNPTTGLVDGVILSETPDSSIYGVGPIVMVAADVHKAGVVTELCRYEYLEGERPPEHVFLSSEEGTLTHEQAAACVAQAQARCDELGF